MLTQTVKNQPAMRGPGFDPWVVNIPGEGNGYPLQYSRPKKSMDRGAWPATVHAVAKNQT